MASKEEKMTKRETQALGRFLGWLAKKNPQLYQELAEEAEERGVKVHELIEESIWFYLIELKSKKVGADITAHLASLDFWTDIEERLVERRVNQILDFFSKFFGLYTNLLGEISKQVELGNVGKVAEKKLQLFEKAFNKVTEIMDNLPFAGKQVVKNETNISNEKEVKEDNKSRA